MCVLDLSRPVVYDPRVIFHPGVGYLVLSAQICVLFCIPHDIQWTDWYYMAICICICSYRPFKKLLAFFPPSPFVCFLIMWVWGQYKLRQHAKFLCAECEAEEWNVHGNNEYSFVSHKRTFAESEDMCRQCGATLASVHDDEEFQFIRSLYVTVLTVALSDLLGRRN